MRPPDRIRKFQFLISCTRMDHMFHNNKELMMLLLVVARKFVCFLLKTYIASFLIMPIFAVYQERRLWKLPTLPRISIWGSIKLYVVNALWFFVLQLGSLILLPFYIIGINIETPAHWVERYTAYFINSFFVGPIIVRGQENLPPSANADHHQHQQQPHVYIANHNSQIDGGAVYFLHRRFKWILKQSIVYLPGVGLLMRMARHVFIDRDTSNKNKHGNVRSMYAECNKALQSGKSIFIFPQGTRSMVEPLPFKDGAFNIAMESQVPIIPISIHIPTRAWNDAYPFNLLWNRNIEPIVLTIHKAIPVTKDTDREALKEQCYNIIYSALPAVRTPVSAIKKND